ncbi:Receptor protein kinase CLAVATA1 precursor, partial [Reticulomyxa filosa]
MKSISLTGTIPLEIKNLTNLMVLYLRRNELNIPKKEKKKKILTLYVYIIKKIKWYHSIRNWKFNRTQLFGLSGTIPKEIGNLVNLGYLFLNQNELTGTIPVEIENLLYLVLLGLSRNKLTGTIPKGIENMSGLQYLMLGDNKLSGELPQLDILPFLQIIVLNNNMLSGTIPFGDSYHWKELFMLSLEKNMFSGDLPKLPDQMNFTSILTLHMNQFSDHNLHDWYIYVCIYSKKKKKKKKVVLFFFFANLKSNINNLRLNKLFKKAPALQILSIYDNPHLTGHLPSSLYDIALEMFLAHGCEINGVLPSSDVQGSIRFVTLIQNRLSGVMPSNLIQTNANKINTIATIYDGSELLLSFNVSTKLENGLYLLGNRFSASKEWYQIFRNQELPEYVSKDERNAKNLYVTKESDFTETMLIGFIMLIILFLSLRKLMSCSTVKRLCNNKMICCFKIRKLPDHIGFKQMKTLLKWFNNWFAAVVVISLVIIYAMNTTYYEKGYLLSHFSLAYVEDLSLTAIILLIIIVLLSNIVVLVYAFQWTVNPSFITTDISEDTFDDTVDSFTWQKGIILVLLFIGWTLIATIVMLYFAFESFPDNNTLHISTKLVYTIQVIMSLALSLHNSLIAPNLSIYIIELIFYIAGIHNRKLSQKWYSYITLCLQTLICIVIPLIFASYFYNDCGRQWVNYWDTCSGKDSNQAVASYRWTYHDLYLEWSMDANVQYWIGVICVNLKDFNL